VHRRFIRIYRSRTARGRAIARILESRRAFEKIKAQTPRVRNRKRRMRSIEIIVICHAGARNQKSDMVIHAVAINV